VNFTYQLSTLFRLISPMPLEFSLQYNPLPTPSLFSFPQTSFMLLGSGLGVHDHYSKFPLGVLALPPCHSHVYSIPWVFLCALPSLPFFFRPWHSFVHCTSMVSCACRWLASKQSSPPKFLLPPILWNLFVNFIRSWRTSLDVLFPFGKSTRAHGNHKLNFLSSHHPREYLIFPYLALFNLFGKYLLPILFSPGVRFQRFFVTQFASSKGSAPLPLPHPPRPKKFTNLPYGFSS